MSIRLIRAIAGFLFAAVSMSASAIINPCDFFRFSPETPGPTNIVFVNLDLTLPSFGYVFDTSYVRTRVNAGAFDMDIVLSTATDNSFLVAQGFTLSGVVPNYGAVRLGTFNAGTYQGTTTIGFYDGKGDGQTIQSGCRGFATLVVSPQSAPVQTASVIEYYDALIDHYFITQNPQEIAALDGGLFPGWVRTGKSFLAYLPNQSDNRGNQVCRWYAILSGRATHFLSGSVPECALVSDRFRATWQQETVDAFEIALPDAITGICQPQTMPVYRVWNGRVDSDHRYLTDIALRDSMVAMGYYAEGYGPDAVAMCAPVD
jgi:hypothetical protein